MNIGYDPEALRLRWQATHPYRIIYSLYLGFGPLPEDPPKSSSTVIIQLDRNGMGTGKTKPRPPKTRAIDLRAGDDVLLNGRWRTIREIVVYRDGWMDEELLARYKSNYGYIYRPA